MRALGIYFPLVIGLLSEHNWETVASCSCLVFVSRNEPSMAAAQLDTSRTTSVENNTAIHIVVAGTESACELELKKRKSPHLVAKADNVNLCCRNNSITLSLTSRVRSDE